jgi:hypothetical protein
VKHSRHISGGSEKFFPSRALYSGYIRNAADEQAFSMELSRAMITGVNEKAGLSTGGYFER